MDTNYCMVSAISAGLGAMTFRNHLRSLTEISDKTKARLKTVGKIGVGALAVGGAAKLAYDHIKGNDPEQSTPEIENPTTAVKTTTPKSTQLLKPVNTPTPNRTNLLNRPKTPGTDTKKTLYNYQEKKYRPVKGGTRTDSPLDPKRYAPDKKGVGTRTDNPKYAGDKGASLWQKTKNLASGKTQVFSGDKTSAKRNVHNSGGYTGPSLKPKDDSGYKG